jgi:hypothetical protein
MPHISRPLVILALLLAAACSGVSSEAPAFEEAPVQSHLGLEDHTAGAVASASASAGDWYLPAKALDGDAATRWISATRDGEWWQADLGQVRTLSRIEFNAGDAYAPAFTVGFSTDGVTFTSLPTSTGQLGTNVVEFTARSARYVRITGLSRVNSTWGWCIYEIHFLGPLASTLEDKTPGGVASASSTAGTYVPALALDGDINTRWISASRDGEWWQIDLGRARTVSRIELTNGGSHAPTYRVGFSTDGVTFQNLPDQTSTIGKKTLDFTERSARYVRITGLTRADPTWGWTLDEFRVYGPAEGTTPPPVSVLPKPLMPLAPGSPFTTPLPVSVPLHSASEQTSFRSELRYMLNASSVRVEQSQYSAALYIVYRNGDVYDTAGRKKAAGVPFIKPSGGLTALNNGIEGRGWPIASWMKPDPGEGHMALYNPETGAYGEFIGAQVGTGSMSYGYGGYIADARTSLGMSSQPNPWWGGTAFGLNLMSFTITDHEIRKAVERYQAGDYENAYIPHLIGYEAYRHHPNQWYYPASKTDDMGSIVPSWGVGGDPNRLGNGTGVLRMGGIFRLDPSINVQTQVRGDGTAFGDMMARIIARTFQKHGATMTDQTEGGFCLLAEHVRKTDGTYDTGAFSYGSGAPWSYGAAWLKPMMLQIIDNGWLQFVYTGRNLETDTGGTAPSGAYRPPQ